METSAMRSWVIHLKNNLKNHKFLKKKEIAYA